MQKYIFFSFFLLLFFTTCLFAQWEWYNPLPNSNSPRSIEILSDSIFIVLDAHGNVLLTEDSGITYNNISVFSDEFYPLKMKFVSKNIGWFIGNLDERTLLVSTTDGCNTFNSHLEGNLSSMFFLNEDIGWITSSEAIYFTDNGGEDWKVIGNTNSSFSEIYFLNNNLGYAVGYGDWGNNAIFKSTDGGCNWLKIYSGQATENYTSLYFINDSSGYVVGRKSLGTTRGVILKTANGGNDWNINEISYYHEIYDIEFISDSIGFCSGYGYADSIWNVGVSKTINAGESWNKIQEYQYKYNSIFFNIGELDLFNQSKITAVFGNYPLIISSEDLGNSWNTLSQNHFTDSLKYTNQEIQSIYFPTENIGFLNTEKAIFKTINSGLSWELIKKISDSKTLNYMSVADVSNIWAVGDNGFVIKSNDGGDTWNDVTLEIYDFSLYNIDLIENLSKDEIIIFCSKWVDDMVTGGYYISPIYKTKNSGDSWIKVGDLDSKIKDAFFLNNLKGWVIGDHIFNTNDGGASWQKIDNLPDYNGLNCIFFHSDLLGFAAGTSGKVLMTENGGYIWEAMSGFESGQFFYDINFWDNKNGFLVGRDGLIISTSDGGKNWVNNSLKSFSDFTKLTFYKNRGWLIGESFSVLTYDFNLTYIDFQNSEYCLNNYELFQNYPNPFNQNTVIEYNIPQKSRVVLKVFDILGRIVATLVDEEKSTGKYQVEFNAQNLSSGVYFYQLKTKDYEQTNKMLLLR